MVMYLKRLTNLLHFRYSVPEHVTQLCYSLTCIFLISSKRLLESEYQKGKFSPTVCHLAYFHLSHMSELAVGGVSMHLFNLSTHLLHCHCGSMLA